MQVVANRFMAVFLTGNLNFDKIKGLTPTLWQQFNLSFPGLNEQPDRDALSEKTDLLNRAGACF
jgi:hypothetical protein